MATAFSSRVRKKGKTMGKKAESSTSSEPSTEVKQKNLRRSERAKLVAKLGETGSPWAAAATQAHREINALEDQLHSKRNALMGILRSVKDKA